MTNNAVAECVLTDRESEGIRRALETPGHSPYVDIDEYLLDIYPVGATFPRRLLKTVFEVGRFNSSASALLVRNLPIDKPLMDTPTDGGRTMAKKTVVSEGVLLGITQMVGEVVGYQSEKRGEIIHNVIPDRAGKNTQSNRSYGTFLNFHNDLTYDVGDRFYRTNPDFLALLCLRQDPDGEAVTFFVPADRLVTNLSAEDVTALRQREFRFSAPHTYIEESGKREWSDPMSVLDGPVGACEIRLAASGVEPQTRQAGEALRNMYEVCNQSRVHTRFVLRSGDLLLLNNRKGVHARSPFAVRFDGTDRWLQRVYIRKTLWPLRARATSHTRVFQ